MVSSIAQTRRINKFAKELDACERFFVLLEKHDIYEPLECQVCGLEVKTQFSMCFAIVRNEKERDWGYRRTCLECTDLVYAKLMKLVNDGCVQDAKKDFLKTMSDFKNRLEFLHEH